MMFNSEPMWRPYASIMHSVRTGRPAFDEVYGMPIYDYLATDGDLARLFQQTAIAFYRRSTGPIVAAYDFGRHERIVDVGGGVGYLLAAILRANPSATGVLLELPPVLEPARAVLAEEGLADRVDVVAGDFFDAVPEGGDLYVIKSCLHNLPDDKAVDVLRVLRRTGAPLLVVDAVVPTGNGPHYAKIDDIEMLVIAGGIDRREDEWAELLLAGGFELVKVHETTGMVSLLEAVPA
jgi:SAM-dependent methyltransferase